MRIVDVNILIYVTNRDSQYHSPVLNWWNEALNGTETVGIPWIVLTGFLRISTNPRLLDAPLLIESAIAEVDGWLARPNVKLIGERETHWDTLRGLLQQTGAAGNRATDAHLAALAISRDATLVSCDAGFKAYRGLRWLNPIA